MINTTTKEIHYVENSFEVLDAISRSEAAKPIEVDLERILVEQYKRGLPNDLEGPI